jgi:hypothetical protein
LNQHIPDSLRRLVRARARDRCEYCGLAQVGQEANFHIDHIQPLADGGTTTAGNLALCCVSCSLRKGARRYAADPESGEQAQLFHPRDQAWIDHFRWDGYRLTGLTPTGRATVSCLRMNRDLILAIREEEAARGRHPPPGPGPARIS